MAKQKNIINQPHKEIFLYTPASKLPDALNIWFCFPALYSIGMSSLGYLHIFRLMDENPKANCQRVFTDTADFSDPKGLDLIGFSSSFEFDFLNIFKMLEEFKIPLSAKDREENCPLIFGGGIALSANPKPISDIFDFILIGDGEEVINKITDKLYEIRTLSRKEKLIELAKIEGIYVPGINNCADVKKQTCRITNAVYTPIITADTLFDNMFVVEVTRGCPFQCNFCLASHLNQPVRYASYESIIEAINIGLEKTDKIGLLGALVPANPCFKEVCEYLYKLRDTKKFQISISSLRVDSIDDLTVKTLVKCGQKSATIAIEAGSQRMRDLINKNLKEEEIFNAIDIIYKNGLKAVKIYAIIGFPEETQDDTEALITLMKNIKQRFKTLKLTLALNTFIPKRHTPFENTLPENKKTLEKKLNLIKKEMHKLGIALRPSSINWDWFQYVISCADERGSEFLKKTYSYGSNLGSFKKAYRDIYD
ncbi:MAG: radical SAM protein [Candidatus Gastranaerophilales bacterium]|nr:radical SAM protein [Candidatus Gastranaerophilales bacterium]